MPCGRIPRFWQQCLRALAIYREQVTSEMNDCAPKRGCSLFNVSSMALNRLGEMNDHEKPQRDFLKEALLFLRTERGEDPKEVQKEWDELERKIAADPKIQKYRESIRKDREELSKRPPPTLEEVLEQGKKRMAQVRPSLANLFEKKVIYRERFIYVVRLENVEISPGGFSATAVPLLGVAPYYLAQTMRERGGRARTEQWRFGASWKCVTKCDDSEICSAYGGWTIWLKPDLVRAVELLLRAGLEEHAVRLL